MRYVIWQRLSQYVSVDSKFLRRHTEMMQETVKDKANNSKERDEGN